MDGSHVGVMCHPDCFSKVPSERTVSATVESRGMNVPTKHWESIIIDHFQLPTHPLMALKELMGGGGYNFLSYN